MEMTFDELIQLLRSMKPDPRLAEMNDLSNSLFEFFQEKDVDAPEAIAAMCYCIGVVAGDLGMNLTSIINILHSAYKIGVQIRQEKE